MKSTQTCPKCAGRKFATIDEFQIPDLRDRAERAAHGVPAVTIESKPDRWGKTSATTVGSLEQWICMGCGYTEFYTRDLEMVAEAARQFPHRVRVVDAGPHKQGPFR